MIVTRHAAEFVTAGVTAAVGAVVCYGSLQNGVGWGASGPEPGYFPFYIGCLIVLGSAGAAAQAAWRSRTVRETFVDGAALRTVAAFFLPLVALALLSELLGLYVAMALYLFFATWLGGKLWPQSALLIAVVVTGANFLIFEKLFMVPLLKGPLLEYFGVY